MIYQATNHITLPFMAFCSTLSSTGFNRQSFFPSLSPVNMIWKRRLATFAFITSPQRNVLLPPPLLATYPPDRCLSRRDFFGSSTVMLPFLMSSFSPAVRRATSLEASTSSSNTRIGIVGGGIAGVTAAYSLAKRVGSDNVEIVVLEGDSSQAAHSVDHGKPPEWKAATARNANSLVPGAAMHLMSTRDTLFQVMRDTIREFVMVYVEGFQNVFEKRPSLLGSTPKEARIQNIENFDIQPPYFALHLFRCLGVSASMEERISFIRFLKSFMIVALFGDAGAEERAACLVQLAKANRVAVRREIADGALTSKVGLSQGFLSLHRTHASAQKTVEECQHYDEDAKILSWHEAIVLEPRLKRLPIQPLYAVHRMQDNTANCETFVQHLIDKCCAMGVEYQRNVEVADLQVFAGKDGLNVFQVTSADGTQREFDFLILASGTQTPLLAAKLGGGASCPTYPLRGYSLTVFVPESVQSSNLLNQPFSVDSMYCSSVSSRMLRFAGFGELVGYRDKAVNVPSLGPRVLARYATEVCPEANVSETDALQCFRPISPDDLPLVGEVSSVPGLWLHTGHGTLGWTLSLATADCIAQAVADRIEANGSPLNTFTLPDGTTLGRDILSPDRFI